MLGRLGGFRLGGRDLGNRHFGGIVERDPFGEERFELPVEVLNEIDRPENVGERLPYGSSFNRLVSSAAELLEPLFEGAPMAL